MTDTAKAAIATYKSGLQRLFGNELIGIYLTGSAALGGFREGKSDIDCTVLLQSKPNKNQIKELDKIHYDISHNYKKLPFESQYITREELGERDSPLFYSYREGKIDIGNFNHNAVTWFTLNKYGITVWGQSANELGLAVTATDLSKYVITNVNSYWAYWLQSIKKLSSIKGVFALHKSAIEWGVMGMCRMFFTLSQHDVTSKDSAAQYVLAHVEDKYKRILKEALYIRTGQRQRQYYSPFARRNHMIMFMEHMINECNNLCNSIK